MKEINGRPAVENHIGWPDRADSNHDISYLAVNTINYITINMFPAKFLDSYDNFLKEMSFTCVWEGRPTFDKRHIRLRRYEHTHLTVYDGKPLIVELLLHPKKKKETTEITSRIYYPTEEILDAFVHYFSETQMPNVSFLELTFDSYTNQPQELFDLLDTNLFMKYNRSNPKKHKTTSYQQPVVKSKGMRLYIKEINGQFSVRLELMLRRTPIKKLGIKLETLDRDLRFQDLSRFFDFRQFDIENYLRIVNKRSAQNFKEKRHNKPILKRNWWTQEDSLALQFTHNRYGIEGFLEDKNWLENKSDSRLMTVANIKPKLKMLEGKQYHRFLEKAPEMDEVFFSAINGRSFL